MAPSMRIGSSPIARRRRLEIAAAVAAFVGLLTTPATGQWPTYPTAGIPRLPDGKPNLSAPTPRTLDGKPDLSGLWHVENSNLLATGFVGNVAQDVRIEDVQPWARSVTRERLSNLGKDAPMAHCLPPGLPSLNAFPTIFARIAQTPGLIVIVHSGGGTNDVLRTIFTDGRELPNNPNPTWMGYSIGRWDGETLVVSTSGFNDRAWLDFNGHPQTESLRVTERFRRRDVGHMEYEMTLDDPKVFARPISLRMDKVLATDTEVEETICENEKDSGHLVGGNGFQLRSESLSKYGGTYEFSPGRLVTVTVADGSLVFQEGATGLKRALVPQSESLFVFRNNGGEVEFVKDAQGAISELVVHDGNDRRALRKPANSGAKK